MNVILAVTGKSLKEFLRERTVVFWTYAVPLFFLLVLPVMYGSVPADVVSRLKGGLTLTMVTFLVMTAGQSNLPGSIATDGERGLYLKMASMPVSPWLEGLGRMLATTATSILGGLLILVSGFMYGASFDCGLTEALWAMGFSLLTVVASAGVGLIIAAFVRGESAATHTGVALTLITYFLGGMALPYPRLPAVLQAFARLHPVSSANAAMVYLLAGEEFIGYNPLSAVQTVSSIVSTTLIFVVGMVSYSRFCWRRR
ncbi:ABC transporter permease [Candidatus Bathyarchaeota archaeon]|nr:ABC transporter permease [Candidatus Bathyarchaeota archaeon]